MAVKTPTPNEDDVLQFLFFRQWNVYIYENDNDGWEYSNIKKNWLTVFCE